MSSNTNDLDKKTYISELKEETKKFCENRDWDQYHSPKDLAVAVITESSELLEIFRFKSDSECEEMLRDDFKRQNIADELSDVLYFLLRFAQRYNFDLTSEFLRKMRSNEEKYPVNKFKGSNKKYSEV